MASIAIMSPSARDQRAEPCSGGRAGRGRLRHCNRHACYDSSATRGQTNHENDQRSQRNDRFGSGEFEKIEVGHCSGVIR